VKAADDIRRELGGMWIADIYREKVRPQRTRSVQLGLPEKENEPEILHTLLGIELKVGKKRIACPDLATARYLRVFARIGCREVAVPYDITKISVVADELETAWHKMMLLLMRQTAGMSAPASGRVRGSLIRELRDDINAVGPGSVMPTFDRETRQRK
jgi:hypothetical protein